MLTVYISISFVFVGVYLVKCITGTIMEVINPVRNKARLWCGRGRRGCAGRGARVNASILGGKRERGGGRGVRAAGAVLRRQRAAMNFLRTRFQAKYCAVRRLAFPPAPLPHPPRSFLTLQITKFVTDTILGG